MDSFLVKFNEYTKNKYNYLRLKKVEFIEYGKICKLYFAIPDDIYEKGFDNTVFKDLKNFCQKVSGGYKCEFYIDRLVVSETIVKGYMLELLATGYPFLASSINEDCIIVSVQDKIDIEISIEQDVFDLINGAPFINKIIESVEENFGLSTFITFKLLPIGEIKVESKERKIVSKSFVPYFENEYLCGIKSKSVNKPIFVETINKPYENASIAGGVLQNDKREFEKDENSPYKYYKYNYRIKINDYSGEFTAYYKTNDDDCPLNDVKPNDTIMLQGRISFSERLAKYVMYAKTVYRIELDKEKIKELLTPKPVPDTLKYPSKKYSGQDFLQTQTLFDYDLENVDKDINCVFFTYKSINKGFSPWEICLLSFTNGKADSVYEHFVKVSNLERIDPEYKARVVSSKRFPEYVPDILSFCKNKTVYCKSVDDVMKELKTIAKQEHIECNIDLQEADKLGLKNGFKGEPTFERMLKEYSITVNGNSCYDYAIAMAKLFLKVKK